MTASRIRLAPPERHGEIRDLINLVQPHVPWSESYFQWQYFQSPAGEAKIFILLLDDRVTATCALVPHLFKLRDKEVVAWQLDTLITHPNYRGRGLMHTLIKGFTEEFCRPATPFCFGFPNPLSTRGFTRNGWLRPFPSPMRHCLNVQKPISQLPGQVDRSEPVDGFGPEFDGLWNRVKPVFPFALTRDSGFLNWRYSQKPGETYFPFMRRKDGRLAGLLVMKLYRASKTVCYSHIVDLFAEPDSAGVVEDLLARALWFTQENKAQALSCWMLPEHPYAGLFDAFGLMLDPELPKWLHIFLPERRPELDGVENPAEWHFGMVDSDIY